MSGGSFQGWVIGSVVLAACAMVLAGVGRAWLGRLRRKIVIYDIEPDNGIPVEAIIGLVTQLREKVPRELRRQGRYAYPSEAETLDADIKAGLMTITGRAPIDATHATHAMRNVATKAGIKVVAAIRGTTGDAISELSAGLRTVAPPEVQGLLTALGGILPAQRGWIIRVHVAIRGSGPSAEAGLSLELSQPGGVPDEVATFWTSCPDLQVHAGDGAQVAAVRDGLHELLRPASAWIATRLVSRQLTEGRSVARTVRGIFRLHDQVLTGLQLLLAGQMSLYATREHKKFILGFARQALEDLEQAADMLPGYFRPPMTQGFVYERRGWACLWTDDTAAAVRAFLNAVQAYDLAEGTLRAVGGQGVDGDLRDAEIEAIAVRRAKCRILSGDSVEARAVRDELAKYLPLRDTRSIALYNAACAFAVAMSSPHLSYEERAFCEHHAWAHLGRALLTGGRNDKAWSRMADDEELAALEQPRRAAFAAEIHRLHGAGTPLPDDEARLLVAKVMTTLDLIRLHS